MAYRDAGDLRRIGRASGPGAGAGARLGRGLAGPRRSARSSPEKPILPERLIVEALTLDPSDRAGADVRLARLGARTHADALTPAHVAALFDDYAPRFEASLVGRLAYRGPALLRRGGAAPRRAPLRDDARPRLRHRARWRGVFADRCDAMDGIDLSGAMLKRAAARGIYRGLVHRQRRRRPRRARRRDAPTLWSPPMSWSISATSARSSRRSRGVLVPGGLFALHRPVRHRSPVRTRARFALCPFAGRDRRLGQGRRLGCRPPGGGLGAAGSRCAGARSRRGARKAGRAPLD